MELIADLKPVYTAPTEEASLNQLKLFKYKRVSKYPEIHKFRHDDWETLSDYFKRPEAVRRLIYITNVITFMNFNCLSFNIICGNYSEI